MYWGGPSVIVAIVLMGSVGWLVKNWIRARQGNLLGVETDGETEAGDAETVTRLREENERLTLRLAASEDRLAMLEKIMTEPGYHLSAEIGKLRGEEAAKAASDKRSAA